MINPLYNSADPICFSAEQMSSIPLENSQERDHAVSKIAHLTFADDASTYFNRDIARLVSEYHGWNWHSESFSMYSQANNINLTIIEREYFELSPSEICYSSEHFSLINHEDLSALVCTFPTITKIFMINRMVEDSHLETLSGLAHLNYLDCRNSNELNPMGWLWSRQGNIISLL